MSTAFERVNEMFAEKREAAKINADARRRRLWRELPEIKVIDDQLMKTGSRIIAEITKGKDHIDERLEAIKVENLALNEKRAKLLVENGYPADFSREKYECEKCEDSGYVGLKMCDCFKKALYAEQYTESGLGNSMADKSFETLNVELAYGKSENGVTPRENLAEIVEICKRFAQNIRTKPQYLLMYGGTGLGKTHVTAATCKEAINNGASVIYDSIQNIVHAFWNDADSAYAKYMNCDLLAIDDFGTEFSTQHSVSVIYNIINTRMLEEKSILINSNLDAQEFKKRYDARICSRIFGNFKVVRFFGEDMRKYFALNGK